MKTRLGLILLTMTTLDLSAQQAVPVNEEPNHKMVLKNQYVEVMRVTLRPGESTLLHTHSHDGVAIRLSDARIRIDVPGKPSTEAAVHAGEVSAQAYGTAPFTHRVNSIGNSDFDVIDVEVLKRPPGPDASAIRTPDAENDSARVYRWDLAPGSTTPQHKHKRPYLVVAATSMNLQMTGADGQQMTHFINAGDLHWVDTPVEHRLRNGGDGKGIIVEVELK